jgi:16S rRNA (guanine527-N7)-methyltransferase
MSGAGARLNELLAEGRLAAVDEETAARFGDYVSLILRWNARVNLTAIRDEEGIVSRHIIESIILARLVPHRVASLLDFGSGAGLPGIPIALCRPEIAVTLAESQGKKAAFLQEAVRVLGIEVEVHAGRAEALDTDFDCVILRAVDKMPKAVAAAVPLVAPVGWLALMTTASELEGLQRVAGTEFSWPIVKPLPGSSQRIVAFGSRGPQP